MKGIKLGQRVIAAVSGFKGTVVAKTEWLHGCVRYGVQPDGLDKEGKPFEAQWFDEGEIAKTRKSDGGPRPNGVETG